MCGLVGVIGKITQKEEKLFQTLLFLDTVRGYDSTGFFSLSENYKKELEMFIEKDDVDGPTFLRTSQKMTRTGIIGYGHFALCGHNRAATVGKVTKENAHPFEAGDVVGMHNGTIDKWSSSDENLKLFDVDSEALLNSINEVGAKKAIPKYCGAWSLVWANRQHNRLYFLRNQERPLKWMYINDEKTIVYASEAWMIRAALDRLGYEEADDPLSTVTDSLYFWDYGKWLETKEEKRTVDLRYYKDKIEGAKKKHTTHHTTVTVTHTTNKRTHQNSGTGVQRPTNVHQDKELFLVKHGIDLDQVVPFFLTDSDSVLEKSLLGTPQNFVSPVCFTLLHEVTASRIILTNGSDEKKKFIWDNRGCVFLGRLSGVISKLQTNTQTFSIAGNIPLRDVNAVIPWDEVYNIFCGGKTSVAEAKEKLRLLWKQPVTENPAVSGKEFIDTYKIGNRTLSEQEMEELVGKGCMICGGKDTPKPGFIHTRHHNAHPGDYICKPCVDKGDLQEYGINDKELFFPAHCRSFIN